MGTTSVLRPDTGQRESECNRTRTLAWAYGHYPRHNHSGSDRTGARGLREPLRSPDWRRRSPSTHQQRTLRHRLRIFKVSPCGPKPDPVIQRITIEPKYTARLSTAQIYRRVSVGRMMKTYNAAHPHAHCTRIGVDSLFRQPSMKRRAAHDCDTGAGSSGADLRV